VPVKKTEKSFDCIAFKNKVQEQIYNDIKDLSISEQVEYYRKGAERGSFSDLRKRVRDKTQNRKRARWSKLSKPVQSTN